MFLNLFKPKIQHYDAEIDLSIFDMVAIERTNKYETLITYREGDEWEEFLIPCSPEKHNELVERFRLQVAGRE